MLPITCIWSCSFIPKKHSELKIGSQELQNSSTTIFSDTPKYKENNYNLLVIYFYSIEN